MPQSLLLLSGDEIIVLGYDRSFCIYVQAGPFFLFQCIGAVAHGAEQFEELDPLGAFEEFAEENGVVSFEGMCHRGKDLEFQSFHVTFYKIDPGKVTEEMIAGFVLYFFRFDKLQVGTGFHDTGVGKPFHLPYFRYTHFHILAFAAQRNGIHATIVMPETAPISKQRGTEQYGAEIVLHGNSYDDAFQRATELQ